MLRVILVHSGAPGKNRLEFGTQSNAAPTSNNPEEIQTDGTRKPGKAKRRFITATDERVHRPQRKPRATGERNAITTPTMP